jgi:hypothetical protein
MIEGHGLGSWDLATGLCVLHMDLSLGEVLNTKTKHLYI